MALCVHNTLKIDVGEQILLNNGITLSKLSVYRVTVVAIPLINNI